MSRGNIFGSMCPSLTGHHALSEVVKCMCTAVGCVGVGLTSEWQGAGGNAASGTGGGGALVGIVLRMASVLLASVCCCGSCCRCCICRMYSSRMGPAGGTAGGLGIPGGDGMLSGSMSLFVDALAVASLPHCSRFRRHRAVHP